LGNDIYPVMEKPERLFFIDNLRSALIILVILHHLSVIYAANTPFYYTEPAYQDTLALIVLVVFQLINQSYFLGLFFLISGYFTPGSLDRKGTASFLKDRLMRLGIPTLMYMFILSPIAFIGVYQMPQSLTGISAHFTWQQYPELIGIGPMWFAVMLLVFDFGYAAWRRTTKDRAARPETKTAVPHYRMIAVFILILALSSYLLRIVMPLGKYLFSFPSIAYLPQYLSFFIIGTVAFHHKWFQTIPDSMGKWGFRMALAATLILFPVAFIGTSGSSVPFLGNGHWQSGVYTLWDSTFSVGLCLGLITLFRRSFDSHGRLGQFLHQQAFAVYVFHIPVIVLLALAIRGIHPEQLLKFGLAAVIGVPLCFAVAYLVRRIPLIAKIL
jgi:glucan biosynthesis protein C